MAKLQTTPTELTAAAAVEVMYALHLAVEFTHFRIMK